MLSTYSYYYNTDDNWTQGETQITQEVTDLFFTLFDDEEHVGTIPDSEGESSLRELLPSWL